MSVFDIGDAREFFLSVKRTYNRSRERKVKSTEDILYVIMGLNHLREWIVPGFDKIKGGSEWPVADTPEKEFSKRVYESPEHSIIRNISNMTKHFEPKVQCQTDVRYEASIDDEVDIDSIKNFDSGSPTGFFVKADCGDVSVDGIISSLLRIYEEWFGACTDVPSTG
jgi:hypothetical protein